MLFSLPKVYETYQVSKKKKRNFLYSSTDIFILLKNSKIYILSFEACNLRSNLYENKKIHCSFFQVQIDNYIGLAKAQLNSVITT